MCGDMTMGSVPTSVRQWLSFSACMLPVYLTVLYIGGNLRIFLSKLDYEKHCDSVCQSSLPELPEGSGLNLLLLGKTGHGKSALGNNILGKEVFESKRSPLSVIHASKLAFNTVGRRLIHVVDTPGTVDTREADQILEEISSAISLRPDGYHAFLLVLSSITRITEEEKYAVQSLRILFGESFFNHVIFVFTHGDVFLSGIPESQNVSDAFDSYIRGQDSDVKGYLERSGNRYILVNNLEKNECNRRVFLFRLIRLVDEVIAANNGRVYTNKAFDIAGKERMREQKRQQEQSDRDRRANEERIRRQIEEQLRREAGQNGACFPSAAHVISKIRGRIKISDLRIGEFVLATSGNKLSYEEVYLFSHADDVTVTNYLKISTSEQTIRVSADHYILTHNYKTVSAGNVRVGDIILVKDNNNRTLVPKFVKSVEEYSDHGMYAPLTMSGTVVVDDVAASCYTEALQPEVAHLILLPIRLAYSSVPNLLALLSSFSEAGRPIWMEWSYQNVRPYISFIFS